MHLLKAKKRIGIGVRLAVMVAVLLIIASGAFTIFSLTSQRREAMDMFVRSFLTMSRSLERTLRFSMLEDRRDEIGSAIKQIATEDVIQSVTLVTHRGEPVYGSDPRFDRLVSMDDPPCAGCHVGTEAGTLTRMPAESGYQLDRESSLANIWLPIYNAPECYNSSCHAHSPAESVLGIMQVDVSYAHVEASLSRSHGHLIALSIPIAIVTAIIVLGLIRRWVTNPVRDLLDGTRRVADGDLGHVIPVGEAELGALAWEFNKMQGKLQSSQRQLILSEKLASIGKLSASVAHEINNPLTGILTFAEELEEDSDPADPRLPDFQVIRREAMRCREIVRQLLDFSRQDKPSMRPIDVNELLDHTVRFVSKQAAFRDVEIQMDLQKDLPSVTADPVQLEQVILGLLVNASEAMPKGGKILIASFVHPMRSEIEISVMDTGPGISEENLQRIFEPFFSTKGERSMGIGLAVSWNIINQHGGRLEAGSEPGEGATFRITLPVGENAPPGAGKKSGSEGE